MSAKLEARMLTTLSAIELLGSKTDISQITDSDKKTIQLLTGINTSMMSWPQIQIALAESIGQFTK